jgi:5-carboxymethyl-2-hydroxymuconate isomerase
MAHLIVEYSANLDRHIEPSRLVEAVHIAALETGMFPIGGLRTRAARCDHFRIADGHPDNGFVHLSIRIGAGRTQQTAAEAGKHIFAALTNVLADLLEAAPLAISMDIEEIDPNLSFKKNNLHDIIAQRSRKAV